MDILVTIWGYVWAFLVAAWNWLTFNADSPVALFFIVTVEGYLGTRAAPILWLLKRAAKYLKDGLLTDTEAAGLFWALIALIYGWLPTVHKEKILAYAPVHWHPVILEGMEPGFELVAVPKGRVAEIRGLLRETHPGG